MLGIPWFVAATVLSINHVRSLTVESESAAPGEKPRFLGIRSVVEIRTREKCCIFSNENRALEPVYTLRHNLFA